MKIRDSVLCVVAIVLVLGLAHRAAMAQTNGSFESAACTFNWQTITPTLGTIPGWTVAGDGVDWICAYWQPSDGLRSIDLNNLDSGSISQDAETVDGYTYWLRFDLSGNPDSVSDPNHPWYSPAAKTMGVTVGGADAELFTFDTSVEGNSRANMMWVAHSLVFIADSDLTSILFHSETPGAFGPALDNVRLEVVSEVCHRNFGMAPFKTLSPDLFDVADHIRHGDAAGPCVEE